MKIERLLITPSIAKSILELNTNNRNVKQEVLKRYCNDMTLGNWKQDTGETIKISKNGTLLDGQHRLLAIAKTGKSVYFHVCTELDDQIFDVLDTGSSRNAGDIFGLANIKNASKTPSIIQQYEALKNDMLVARGAQKGSKHSIPALLELYKSDPNKWDIVSKKTGTWYIGFNKILYPQFIGGLYAYFSDINEAQADNFMNQLCTGFDIENKTISILRNILTKDKISIKKLAPSHKIALIIKTWNYYRKGKSVSILFFDANKESNPIAI